MNEKPPYQRRLDIEGAYNVRDLGGYQTAGGRTTRWRTFLRADGLHALTSSDRRKLIDYGVRTVIDLRRNQETVETPDVFAASADVSYRHMNMVTDTNPPGYDAEGEGPAWIADTYRRILRYRQPQIRRILEALADSDSHPLLFHCAAGTDRTGIIAALLLGVAGVPNDRIADDYALSAEGLLARYMEHGPPPGMASHDLTQASVTEVMAPAEAMTLTLKYLADEYNGPEGYMRSIGITADQINSIHVALVGE